MRDVTSIGMGDNVESPYGPDYRTNQSFARAFHNAAKEEIEVIDANTLKERYNQQRAQVIKADGNTAQIILHKQGTKKTKALTTQRAAQLKDFERVIIYCPGCTSYGGNQRMMPHLLRTLLENPEAYAELVGGLAFEDDTIYLHCTRCNLKLLPTVDEVEKLDVREEDEYEISSLADITKKSQKPVLAGQSTRYNKAKSKREEIYNRRKRQAQEQLAKDYEHQQGVKPTE